MTDPTSYFFDMDHTLADNDCDVSWKEFLVARGLAPPEALSEAAKFFEDYRRGTLNVAEFMSFQLNELRGMTVAEADNLAREHVESIVKPTVYLKGRELVKQALKTGCPVMLLTATNEVVARPFAEEIGVPGVLATRLELVDGRYTGKIIEPYCHGPGKLQAAREFCNGNGLDLASAAYYGDSMSDVSMLANVGFPVACNPVVELEAIASANAWRVLHLA